MYLEGNIRYNYAHFCLYILNIVNLIQEFVTTNISSKVGAKERDDKNKRQINIHNIKNMC